MEGRKKFCIYHGDNNSVFSTSDSALDAFLGQLKIYNRVVDATRGCGSRTQSMLDREYKYLVRAYELLSDDEKKDYALPGASRSVNDGSDGFNSGLLSVCK
jgi:hypothetical protein